MSHAEAQGTQRIKYNMKSNKTTSPFSGFIKQREEFIRLCHEEAGRKRKLVDSFRVIFKKYGITKAYLFGSIQKRSCLPHSDIDLYVEFLERHQYWNMWRDLEEMANHPVDLYCQFDDSIFVEKIKRRGELVYESRS